MGRATRKIRPGLLHGTAILFLATTSLPACEDERPTKRTRYRAATDRSSQPTRSAASPARPSTPRAQPAPLPTGAAAAPDDTPGPDGRVPIRAAYLPLADHYAAIVAHELYADEMKHAAFELHRMKSPALLRPYFLSGAVDMAFTISPQAMDMFRERPSFRWVSLLHRDGNALAINDVLDAEVGLPAERSRRRPDSKVADAFRAFKKRFGRPSEVAVPNMQATHTVILYKYLKDHGMTLGLGMGPHKDVVAVEVPPPRSPSYIKRKNSRGEPASFEQSLPWADVVETGGYGHVAWYSKDVLPWPKGHVECIAIATDAAIASKEEALREVIEHIHRAGKDIERSREKGGAALLEIAAMVRRHIPEHTEAAIVESLDPRLNVINYNNLNLDTDGLEHIMDLAVEAGIIPGAIDVHAFADKRFATRITEN